MYDKSGKILYNKKFLAVEVDFTKMQEQQLLYAGNVKEDDVIEVVLTIRK